MRRHSLVVAAVLALGAVVPGAKASQPGPIFATGDVFVGIYYDQVGWLSSDLGSQMHLDGGGWGYDCPSALDSRSRLLVANYNEQSFAVLSPDGSLDRTVSTGIGNPNAIVVDPQGAIFVGHAWTGAVAVFSDEYQRTGTLQVEDAGNGVWGATLLDDGCTLAYSSEQGVLRYDLCLQTQLPDLAASLSGSYAAGLTKLSGGGFLVADHDFIVQLDANGAVVRTYDAPGVDTWVSVAVEPGGSTFLAGDYSSSNVFRFDLATGAVLLGPISVAEPDSLCGLVVFDRPSLGIFVDGFESGDVSLWSVPQP